METNWHVGNQRTEDLHNLLKLLVQKIKNTIPVGMAHHVERQEIELPTITTPVI
jgi:precorrin-3B methylase